MAHPLFEAKDLSIRGLKPPHFPASLFFLFERVRLSLHQELLLPDYDISQN